MHHVPLREWSEAKSQHSCAVHRNCPRGFMQQKLDRSVRCSWNARELFDEPTFSRRDRRENAERDDVLIFFDRNENSAVIESRQCFRLDQEVKRWKSATFQPFLEDSLQFARAPTISATTTGTKRSVSHPECALAGSTNAIESRW